MTNDTPSSRLRLLVVLAAVPLFGVCGELAAQSVDTLPSMLLDQVAVSAYVPQRLTGPSALQPTAQSWISKRSISDYNVQTLSSLTSRVPSLFIPDYGSRGSAAIYLRGSGARSAGQTIGLYVDGVPVLNKAGFNVPMLALSGIEVLRGPQGTLYGRNAMSGIVNYYTRSAFDHTGGEVRLRGGLPGTLGVDYEHSLRLSPKVGLTWGYSYEGRRGYFYNETTRAYQDSLRQHGAFAKLEYRPSADLEMALSAQFNTLKQGAFTYRNYNPRTGVLAPLEADAPDTYSRTQLALRYLLSYRMGWAQLQSATGYQYHTDDTHMDMEQTRNDFFHVQQRLHEHGFTQEFILKNLPREQRYQWSVGLFGYYDRRQLDVPVNFTYQGISAMVNGQFAAQRARNPRMPDLIYFDAERRDPENLNAFRLPDWGVALYHESRLRLTPTLTATAGLRLDYERHEIDYSSRGFEMGLSLRGTNQLFGRMAPAVRLEGNQSVDYLNLLPKVSLAWRPTEALYTYATVAQGLKTGGFNEQSFSDLIITAEQLELQKQMPGSQVSGLTSESIAERTTYRPERSWSYELGARYDRPDWGLHLEGAAYFMQVSDLQLTRFVASGAGRIVGNAGRSHTLGLELAASKRLTEWLRLQLSYSFTEARFDEDQPNAAVKGNYVPFIPQQTFSALLAYNVPLAGRWSLFGQGEWAGLGRIYWDEANQYKEGLQSTLRANIGVRYDRCSLSLWGTNLADASSVVFQAPSPLGTRLTQLSQPRTLGLELSYRL